MSANKEWFAVDRAGLGKILRRRGIEFAVFELIQNAWDEDGVTRVEVTLAPDEEKRGHAVLKISDDAPEGFKDLSHAFTLFAESAKKSDAEKRGRFNLGEKLVLALCESAAIYSMTGSVKFNGTGRRVSRVAATVRGTDCFMRLKMNREEIAEVNEEIYKLISPAGIETVYNGTTLLPREVIREVFASLPTEIADSEGALRKARRNTAVRLYKPEPGEVALIYEMGIPVVEHDCAFHCDVQQKVPITLDRENVTPRFLRALRTAVFNAAHELVTPEQATAEWAQTAIESADAQPLAVADYMTKRFGERRVSYDPSDLEANKRAVSEGYTVVHGGMLSADAWSNVRTFEAIKPAGQVTPSAKAWNGEDNPDAAAATPIPFEKWTDDMRQTAIYAERFARLAIGAHITVEFYATLAMLAAACYGSRSLSFNKSRLGSAWFNLEANRERIDDLLIHELGHEYSGDHLSEEYYKALTKIGARMIAAARKGDI
jgi:hypothetical protein